MCVTRFPALPLAQEEGLGNSCFKILKNDICQVIHGLPVVKVGKDQGAEQATV